jgi:hypothetical protein
VFALLKRERRKEIMYRVELSSSSTTKVRKIYFRLDLYGEPYDSERPARDRPRSVH